MTLTQLRIKNFRIFDTLSLNFHPEINIIYGLNGQGKTTVLEAIYYLSISKSFRAKNDTIVLKHECDYFDVQGNYLNQEELQQQTRIYFSKNEGKHAFVNKSKVKLFSEIIGRLPVILLSLEDIELTSGVPASRRKFLDVLLSQLYPGYLLNLQRYKKSILQKNKLLSADDRNVVLENLKVWNQQIAEYGAKVLFQRLRFIEFLNSKISSVYHRISGKNENIEVRYSSTVNEIKPNDPEKELNKIITESLEKYKETEIKRQTSVIGPHRDDIDFLKDGYPFKTHGSQGENKSFLLALKFLESEYIHEISDKKPLVLLDDIFGELDEKRIENLLHIIKSQGQTFITTTHNQKFEDIVDNKLSMIHINNEMQVQ